jgi:gamma-carbonic anhydrase
MILKYKDFIPEIDPSVFIAGGSFIIGNVKIEKNASIWFNCVLRGDMDRIHVGENSNIQDGSVMHCIVGTETRVGRNVIVGHNAVLHSCDIGDGSLIGMGSVILDNVRIGKNCLIGAGSLVVPNMVIPDNSFVLGRPARIKKELTSEEISRFQKGAADYIELAGEYLEMID